MSVRYLEVEILTPTHIGAGKEKFWTTLDYIQEGNEIKVIDWDAIFESLIDDALGGFSQDVLNAVNKDNLEDIEKGLENIKRRYFQSNQKIKESIPFAKRTSITGDIHTSYRFWPRQGESVAEETPITGDIHTHIRDGIGNVYLPGSSIKGGIVSVYYSIFARQNRQTIETDKTGKIEEVFGSQENSPLRLVEVTDGYFLPNSTKIYPTKIYSLRGNNEVNFSGGWKNGKKESDNSTISQGTHNLSGWKNEKKENDNKFFDEKGFVTFYECLDIGKKGYFRIKFNEELLRLNAQKGINLTNSKIIFNKESNNLFSYLFEQINLHTKNYLNKELEFFERFGGVHSKNILETINNLINIVNNYIDNENQNALLHLGSGSGFHGITGDWQYENHLIDNIFKLKRRGIVYKLEAFKKLRGKLERFLENNKENPYDLKELNVKDLIQKSSDLFNLLEETDNMLDMADEIVENINEIIGTCIKLKKDITISNKKIPKVLLSILNEFFESQYSAKTRRLVFESSGNGFVFYPMGFVKLSVVDEATYTGFLNELNIQRANKYPNNTNTLVNNKSPQANPDEGSQMDNKDTATNQFEITPYTGKIKSGQGGIPAEVVESGRPNKVRIFIKDYNKNDIVQLTGYSSPIEKGKKLWVKIGNMKKDGEIFQVGFEKFFDV